MGKVRKLRKKYKALCSKSNEVSSQKSSLPDKMASILESMNRIPPTSESMSVIDEGGECRSTARSTYSISKSIKSSLGGRSILKKDKQKLRHEIFLKRLDASKEAFDRCKRKGKKVKRLDFKDELPPLKFIEEDHNDSRMLNRQQTKTETKNINKPRKGMLKHRNERLAQNVQQFKKLLGTNASHST